MLIEFTVKNYRSFRDEATLSMEATGVSTLKSVLIPYGGMRILPGAAIYGKNGGVRAMLSELFGLRFSSSETHKRHSMRKQLSPLFRLH